MRDQVYHSAEGSTWTKKNHKYIRKEGNRYIYPEDLKSNGNRTARDIISDRGITRVNATPTGHEKSDYTRREYTIDKGNVRKTVNKGYYLKPDHPSKYNVEAIANPYNYDKTTYESKPNNLGARGTKTQASRNGLTDHSKIQRNVKRSNALNSKAGKAVSEQKTPDYKKLSQQKANRTAAANGKIVNPTYNMRDDKGNLVFRYHSNDKVQMPSSNDYQQYSKLRAGEKNRSKNVNKQGSNISQENAKQQVYAQKRKTALSKQGSVNRQKEAKDFKEYRDWEKNDIKKRDSQSVKAPKEYYDAVRSNTKNEKEFNEYLDSHNVARPDGSKPQKVETWDNTKNIETWDNSKNIKTWDNEKAKKSTKGQKGHFTYDEKSGQTIFVPDDERTKKRVSKGKGIVDKIKSKLSKKK